MSVATMPSSQGWGVAFAAGFVNVWGKLLDDIISPPPSSSTVRQLATFGGNSGFPDYYVERPVFANAVLQGGMFRILNNSDTAVATNSNGNPLADFSQVLWALSSSGSDAYYLGTYKCTATFPNLPGTAPTITYTTGGTVTTNNKVYNPVTGIMTWDMVVSAMGANSLSYNISGTGNLTTNIAIWRPGINPADPPIYSEVDNRVNAEFGTLRCMDLDQVNVATITDWTNRNTPSNWQQGSDRYQAGLSLNGVPNEYIVALYSEAGATTLWRCCPTTLTTLSSWCSMLASSLPSGKKVVVEMSNEVWNSAFAYTYHTNYKAALIATNARRLVYSNATFSSNEIAALAGEYFSTKANVSSITSNGTTATMTFDGIHGLSNGNMNTVGLQDGWNVGSVGSIIPAVAPSSVAYTVVNTTSISYPCTANGTMSMAPNGAAGVFFNPTSNLLVGIQGIYDINLRRHALRSRELGIAAKAAFTSASRLADLDVNVSWQSGATDQMQTILNYMDYLDSVDGLGGSEVIDSVGFAIYCDLTLDRIAGAGLADQTHDAITPTEILDAIETQVSYAERAYSLSNYTALARDRQKKLRIYELGIDTQGSWANVPEGGGNNFANVLTANQSSRIKTILKSLIDSFYKAGADQINYYRNSVGSYANSGCFYLGQNTAEVDPLTLTASQSNRMQAIQEVLNAPPSMHTRHLLNNVGTVTTIDGRDRINFTQWTVGDQFPVLGSAGYFDILKETHLGYEVTAPTAGTYKLQLRVLLTTTASTTGYIRQRGTNVTSFSVPNRGGSNTVDENLEIVTLTLEKGVNYFYVGGLADQAQNSAFKIKSLTLVDADFAFPVGISGTPATTANVNQPYTGFTVTAFNGTTPYVYSLVGSWPAGISINTATGAVSGTPTATGTFNSLSVRVTDANASTADITSFSLVISVGDTLVASDNFNGLANNTILRNESGWGAYNSSGSTDGVRDLFTVQSGVATWPNDQGGDWSYPGTFVIGRDLGIDQQAIEFEFSTTPGASALFWFCADDQADGLFLNMPSPGNPATLSKVVAGTVTELASFTGVSFASGDKVMIRRYGSNCAVYKNDTLVQSNIAIGTFTGGTKAGAGSYLRLGSYNYINWFGPITQLLKP